MNSGKFIAGGIVEQLINILYALAWVAAGVDGALVLNALLNFVWPSKGKHQLAIAENSPQVEVEDVSAKIA